MRVLMRSTTTLDEYWCTKEKRIISLPKGTVPDFEVIETPTSMLGEIEANQTLQNEQGEKYLQDMNLKELRAYAAEHDITIPFEIKKTEAVRKFILAHEENKDEDNAGE